MAPKGQDLRQKKAKADTFLEALRDVGKGVAQDALKQTGVWPQPQESFSPNELINLQERRRFEERFRRLETVQRQEKLLFTAQKREENLRLRTLQEEVKKLASAVTNLDQETKITASQTLVEPGIYHQTFFEKLISFIKSIREKVENASVWLAAGNRRKKGLPFYWAQVQKSGTKFMLSQERYMATQVG